MIRRTLGTFVAAAVLAAGCSGSTPTTPTGPTAPAAAQQPPVVPVPVPPAVPGSATFSIALPIRPADSAHNAYGLVPFGVHIGDHGVDGHPGWDFEYVPGASVYAAAAGTVQSVLPSGNGTGFGIQITHVAGTKQYRTIYGVAALAPGVTAGATVVAGQALGAADVFTRTIGRTMVTYGMTHFQVDDFSSSMGLTNPNAVSADTWLDPSARAALEGIWRDATYTQELVEPFLSNPRDAVYPLTRSWTLESGGLAARIDFTAPSPTATTFDYALRDATGAIVETGVAEVDALAKPFSTIDFRSTSGQLRRGVFDVLASQMQLDYGAPGASRPTNLSFSSSYRTR